METILLANKRRFETQSAIRKCNEPLSVATRTAAKILRFLRLSRKANFLKQAEQLEDDYDDNNYSDYVEDVSVHARDCYQSEV